MDLNTGLGLLGCFASIVASFITLRVKVIQLEKDMEKLESKHDALENKIFVKLSLIERSLAKIEGRLSLDNDKS